MACVIGIDFIMNMICECVQAASSIQNCVSPLVFICWQKVQDMPKLNVKYIHPYAKAEVTILVRE